HGKRVRPMSSIAVDSLTKQPGALQDGQRCSTSTPPGGAHPMKKAWFVLAAAVAAAIGGRALADRNPEVNDRHRFPSKEHFFARPGGGGSQNLTNHGGPVIHSARVVPIFWG